MHTQTSRVDGSVVAQGLPPRLQQYLNAGLFTPRVGRLGAKQVRKGVGMG